MADADAPARNGHVTVLGPVPASADAPPAPVEPDLTPYDPAAYPRVVALLRRLAPEELQRLKAVDIPAAQRRLPVRVVRL